MKTVSAVFNFGVINSPKREALEIYKRFKGMTLTVSAKSFDKLAEKTIKSILCTLAKSKSDTLGLDFNQTLTGFYKKFNV